MHAIEEARAEALSPARVSVRTQWRQSPPRPQCRAALSTPAKRGSHRSAAPTRRTERGPAVLAPPRTPMRSSRPPHGRRASATPARNQRHLRREVLPKKGPQHPVVVILVSEPRRFLEKIAHADLPPSKEALAPSMQMPKEISAFALDVQRYSRNPGSPIPA